MKLENGTIYYINFSGNKGREINKIHLGIIYKLPSISDVIFCIPLTSPKSKHFKTEEDYNKRNYKNIIHFSWQYIKQTDSIDLLDQMKTISIDRLQSPLTNEQNDIVILTPEIQLLLKNKVLKYLNYIMKV